MKSLKISSLIFRASIVGILVAGIVSNAMGENFFLGILYMFLYIIPFTAFVSGVLAVAGIFHARKAHDLEAIHEAKSLAVYNGCLLLGTVGFVIALVLTFDILI